jgi:acetolactate synthase-1/2/3 large subunit
VIADCKESLPAITKLLKQNEHREWRDSFKPLFDEENKRVIQPAIHPTEGPLLMGEVTNVVAEATHGDAVLVNDVGQNQMMSSRYFRYKKNRSIVTSGGLGTMGFGLPAAIGATFGAPDRTVCMFCGDGGLQMSIQEFGTIMEQQYSCQDHPAQQQLSGQCAPVAGYVLRTAQIIYKNDESSI